MASWWPGTRRPSASGGRCVDGEATVMLAARLAAAARAGGAGRPLTQAGLQLAAQLAARVHVDRLVDGLVADLHVLIAWVVHLQPPADLLG